MTRTYWWQTPAGCLSIRQYEKGPWRLWAGEEFVARFSSPEEALGALKAKAVPLPPGDWKAPVELERWRIAVGKLPPAYF